MKILKLIIISLFLFSGICFSQKTVIQDFESVLIGDQEWMVPNLNVSFFRNGEKILEAKTSEQWVKYYTEGTSAWCYYDFKAENGQKYGKLYNWFAVHDERGLAPEGWRVSTCEDWEILAKYAGGTELAGKKLRSKRGWHFDQNGTDEFGFNGSPAGSINAYGMFGDINNWGSWWCYNPLANPVYGKYLKYDNDMVTDYASYLKTDGLSVKCICEINSKEE